MITVLTYEELVAAIASGEEIILGDHISVPEGETITIPRNQEITIDLGGFTIHGTRAASFVGNSSLLYIDFDAVLNLSNGGILLNGSGDASFANYANAITVQSSILNGSGLLVQNDIAEGISCGIDVINNSAAKANLTDCFVSGKRYAVRQFVLNQTKANEVIGTDCQFFSSSSTGIMIQNADSRGSGLSSLTLKNSWVQAPRGLYIWDSNSGPVEEKSMTINLEKGASLMANITPDPAGDAYLPGYEGEIVVDYSGGQHADRVQINDKRHTHAEPFSISFGAKVTVGGRKLDI